LRYRKTADGVRYRIVCTRLYLLSNRLYLKGTGSTAFSKYAQEVISSFFEISQNDRRGSVENRLYPFVPPFKSFVPQRDRKYSIFKICSRGNFVICWDITKRPTAFDRESFVLVCIAFSFVCISTGVVNIYCIIMIFRKYYCK